MKDIPHPAKLLTQIFVRSLSDLGQLKSDHNSPIRKLKKTFLLVACFASSYYCYHLCFRNLLLLRQLEMNLRSHGLLVTTLGSQSKTSGFKLLRWLQSRLSLSIRGLINYVSYVLMYLMPNLCLTFIVSYVLPCLMCLLLHVLLCFTALYVLASHVPSCLTCSVSCVPHVPVSLSAPVPYKPLLSRILRVSCANFNVYALVSPYSHDFFLFLFYS